jgi:DNA polymerase-4
MNSWQAKQKCPDLIFVTGDNRKYTWTSSQIVKLMLQFTPQVEVFSIDEAFLDVTGSLGLFSTPENIAYSLKSQIRHHFGITCSIGIAPNKLLAKLASDMQKPDGLTVIKPENIANILERLPVRDLCGVGAKTGRQLALLGIRTCGELGRFPVDLLRRKFGVIGEQLSRMGQGIDDSPVIPAEDSDEVKSVGHSMTLEKDIEAREEILKFLLQLSEMVGRRARRYSVWGKTVTLSIRYADFDTWVGRQETLPAYINRSDDIYRAAVDILDAIILMQPVRLLGVRLSNLRYGSNQLPLFDEERKKQLLADAMDSVNDRFGNFTVTFGSLLDGEKAQQKGSHVISPAWKPEGIRNVEVK